MQHGVVVVPRVVLQKRHAYSVRFKANAVSLLRMALLYICFACGLACIDQSNTVCPGCDGQCTRRLKYQYQVADELGICPSLLSRWKTKTELWLNCPTDVLSKKKLHTGPPPCYPDQEEELYFRFTNLRKNCGFPIDQYWLRAEMNDLCIAQHGANHVLQLSNGWLNGF